MTDYEAFCDEKNRESPRRRKLLFLPRVLTNPSLQAVLLLRIGNITPPPLRWIIRQILMVKHSMDWTGPFEIGPRFVLPHPVMVTLGPGVRIGADVHLMHNVSIGADAHGRGPVIGDRVHVYPGAVIIGDLTIGEESIVGANSFVGKDVPPRSVVKRDVVEPMRSSSSFARAILD